jgi:hypothetical protein
VDENPKLSMILVDPSPDDVRIEFLTSNTAKVTIQSWLNSLKMTSEFCGEIAEVAYRRNAIADD